MCADGEEGGPGVSSMDLEAPAPPEVPAEKGNLHAEQNGMHEATAAEPQPMTS